ncbi:MAG: EF-hand domain-containing protein [Planctomycetota bacterium]|jgi:hypothetical protein
MKHLAGGLAALALIGLIPLVQAQEGEQKEEKPPAQAQEPPSRASRMLERFDLNRDGRVTWEEYQKVHSGFAHLDADGDGVITQADLEKVEQRARAEGPQRPRARRGGDARREPRRFRSPRGGREHGWAPRRPAPPRGGRGWRGPERMGPPPGRCPNCGRGPDERPRRGPPPQDDRPARPRPR